MRTRFPLGPGLAGLSFAAACALQAAVAAPPQRKPADTGLVRITIDLLRTRATPARETVRLIQASCPVCRQVDDPRDARENVRQTVVALDVPAGRVIEPEFSASPGAFDRAILQTQDVPLRAVPGGLRIALPPVQRETSEAGEFATNIVGTGFVLRFEHADPERRFGAYATTLPVRQRLAADRLEFAFREAVMALGLGAQVARDGLGVIEIMGFDTNDPHGHSDAPPHVHMHLRWPSNTGTQIGHFYLGPDGRLLRNAVGIAGLNAPSRVFQPGMPFDTIGAKGDPVFRQRIEADGSLTLSAPDGRACRIGAPSDDFTVMIHVACDGRGAVGIGVTDDRDAGDVAVRTETAAGAILEHFRYDPRTGLLLSQTTPPVDEPSAIVPTVQGETFDPFPAPGSSK